MLDWVWVLELEVFNVEEEFEREKGREGGRTARWDSPKEDPSRNISLTELVGGASMSVNACLCVLELSNIDSAPKCEAPRDKPLFIFAFVCTTGISSVFCALGDMTLCCATDIM